MERIVIPIDGAAKTGKDEVSTELAGRLRKLGLPFVVVSSGLLYRALAYAALERGIIARDKLLRKGSALELSIEAQNLMIDLARTADFQYCIGETSRQEGLFASPAPVANMFFGGVNITRFLGSPIYGDGGSVVCRIKEVKQALSDRLRAVLPGTPLVMNGRDIGERVFPEAKLKIMLVASDEEVSVRHERDLKPKGRPGTKAHQRLKSKVAHSLSLRRASDACATPSLSRVTAARQEIPGKEFVVVHNQNGKLLEAVDRIVNALMQYGIV